MHIPHLKNENEVQGDEPGKNVYEFSIQVTSHTFISLSSPHVTTQSCLFGRENAISFTPPE